MFRKSQSSANIPTDTAWKKSRFILSRGSDFNMIDSLSIRVHTFPMCEWTSLSEDEILLPRFQKWSINFSGLPLKVEMAPSRLKHMKSFFICVHIEANASCCLFQAVKKGFSFDKCIYKKYLLFCVVYILVSTGYHLLLVFLIWIFSFIRSTDVYRMESKQVISIYAANVSLNKLRWQCQRSQCHHQVKVPLLSSFYNSSLKL